ARKGIFHPKLFTMPELMFLFLAVMLADIILMDLFNSYSLPTSTTVSIVFELLGAAVVVSLLKIWAAGDGVRRLSDYINSSKAMLIIGGILFSVVVAFLLGALIQVLSRLLFTFDYQKRLRRYGALWGGVALASITYFILVKGAKGTSFTPPEMVTWIKDNTVLILAVMFAVSAVLLQGLLLLRWNILKPIVLIGTFALAMAFAANDLVNFIGVPMAGYHAYKEASASADPLHGTMEALAGRVPSETYLLLLAGVVMVLTLWLSRKAQTVAATSIDLGQQTERTERFESNALARGTVRMLSGTFGALWSRVPRGIRKGLSKRFDPLEVGEADVDTGPPFDLLRASVNLMVAAAVISYATSYKLPLSTTYVTFMVCMGTSFADRAWGRDSAVYRVSGVLTVVGGWFLTAVMAFTISGAFALIIYKAHAFGVLALLLVVAFVLWKNHVRHTERTRSTTEAEVFNLKKVADVRETVSTTFEHMGLLVQEIRESLDAGLEALFTEDLDRLHVESKRAKKIQDWTNIVTANIFKTLRLLQRSDQGNSHDYAQTARRLQKLADGHRDILMRSYLHVRNHHKELLDIQVEELRRLQPHLDSILRNIEDTFLKQRPATAEEATEQDRQLRELASELNGAQIQRIGEGSSKTRLSILYYAIVGNLLMISKQSVRLLHSFEESLAEGKTRKHPQLEFDLD
ncbi:MAG: inorganic phosphate transporter, partial [Acidobacteria bacterium]